MTNRSRAWCFTLNNYTEDEEQHFVDMEGHKQLKYMIIGKEVGEQGTPHLQGYIVFQNQKTFDQAKKLISDRAHIEKPVGNAKQNIAYCSKDNEYFEFGDVPSQGARRDIEEVKEQVKNHTPINEIVFNATSYQSARHAELLMKYQPMPPQQYRTIKWYYGESGSGKTRTAIEESEGNYYISMKNLQWWDGYFGQKYIIIDDFRGDFCTFHELLRIIDRYPYRVNLKGTSSWFQPTTTHIIITSCYHPEEVFKNIEGEKIKQLIRRIGEIKLFKNKNICIEYNKTQNANLQEANIQEEIIRSETPSLQEETWYPHKQKDREQNPLL